MLMIDERDTSQGEIDTSKVFDKQTQTPQKLSHDTPRKNRLKTRIISLQRENRKLKEQLKNAQKKSNIKEDLEYYCRLTEKFLSSSVANFVKEQAKLHQQLTKDKKYSMQFKQFCLTIYFMSPKSYKVLRNELILPSPRTLQRSIKSVQISPGLNDFIFDMIEKKIVNFTPLDRLCVICIDEMSLKANLYYNITRDEVIGFENLGHEKKFLPACNAAVIMIRGICKSWKQPFAYYLLNSTFNAVDVQNAVQEIVKRLQNIGLKVAALVTDMGKNYQNMIKCFGVTLENPYFEIDGERIHYLVDPPHLIKATRNNIYINNIKYNSDQISWDTIVTLYNYDKNQPSRLAYKLTDNHIQPSGFDRMKVKYAVHTKAI